MITTKRGEFLELAVPQQRQVRNLRTSLFLSSLAKQVGFEGPNAGSFVTTTENFQVVYQRFTLDNDYIAEKAGVIVTHTVMGYKIGETVFVRPSYVPRPSRLWLDERVFQRLLWLRRQDRALWRRIVRAAAVFIESYYNSESLDIAARVLMQVAAFEALLDLPEDGPRKAFKDLVERFCTTTGERRYRYTYEVRNGSRTESRTQQGIWADRFYTLRNHLIHGEEVRNSEYVYRGVQHHLVISPKIFVLILTKLLDEAAEARGLQPVFFRRVRWNPAARELVDDEDTDAGFRIEDDFLGMYLAQEGMAASKLPRFPM